MKGGVVNQDWFVASYVALWVVVLVSLLLWLAVLRQIGILHNRWGPRGARVTEDGPEFGSEVPRFGVVSAAGSDLWFPDDGSLSLAVLTNPGCSACEELAPALGTLFRDPPEGVSTMVLVTDGGDEAARLLSEAHGLDPRRVASAPSAESTLNVRATPLALLVDEHGRLLNKGIVNSLEQIEVLVAVARHEREEGNEQFQTDEGDEGEPARVIEVVTSGRGEGEL
jgi:methylamine dehydrogenase accessory protein MauD